MIFVDRTVCYCSKKHLPLPPGGLPPPLLAMVSAPAPVPHVKQSIGDAFGALGGDDDNLSAGSSGLGSLGGPGSVATPPVVHSAPVPQHVPVTQPAAPPLGLSGGSDREHVNELEMFVVCVLTFRCDACRAISQMESSRCQTMPRKCTELISRPSRYTNQSHIAHCLFQLFSIFAQVGHSTSSSLKYLLQRIATEKISLSSALTHAEEEVQEIRNKLQGTIAEINGMFCFSFIRHASAI